MTSSTYGAVIGVDGGGTKTDVQVADADGRVLGSASVGCTNHETVGLESAMAELRRGVEVALAAADRSVDDVAAAVFGLAGVDWPSDERTIAASIAEFGLAGRCRVVNDAFVALRAGTTSGWGIVSSVGTGAVVAGVDRAGTCVRTMAVGWGEPCGSSSLVADALHAIAAAHHHTGPPTILTERFLEALGIDGVLAMFEAISRGALRIGGRHAPLVSAAADEGDAVAGRIVDQSAAQHAAMVVGVAERLSMLDDDFELVMSGGVHRGAARFAARFCEAVLVRCPRAVMLPLARPPVEGAVLLALDAATISEPSISEPRDSSGTLR
jgi:N-acetylglucosamine kinase-like BadF-type ATPase